MTHVETPQSICRFAVARGDITPPPGIYHRMWGAASHDQATGVHRPLTATVAVFQPADEAAEDLEVLIALDHCLFWAAEMRAYLNAVSAATGLPEASLTTTFSHTHAAGLMGHERVDLPGGDLIPGYLEDVARRVADLVNEARQRAVPATIVYGTGRCDLAANRDFLDENSGQYVCGYNPTGPVDDTVLVARITASDGTLLATMVNYACHPTTLAWGNTLVSPDYPGAMREVVEQATGAVCLFIQGASGDAGPKHGFVGEVEAADRNGRQLGYAALSALEALPEPGTWFQYVGPVVSGATIGTWEHVPVPDARRKELAHWEERRWTVDLAYRDDLPDADLARSDLARWQAEEQQARQAGDEAKASDARAMAERQTRRLTRVGSLPPGDALPYPIKLWRIGGAVWVALDGEHYNILQRQLRQRFPELAIVVATLANGSTSWYLPAAADYGKGLYQESASILAKGSLEKVIEEVGNAIATWVE